MLSNLEIIGFKKFLGLPNWTRPTASSNLVVRGTFLIQLFPNWTACSPITYTNLRDRNRDNMETGRFLGFPVYSDTMLFAGAADYAF